MDKVNEGTRKTGNKTHLTYAQPNAQIKLSECKDKTELLLDSTNFYDNKDVKLKIWGKKSQDQITNF